MLSCCNIEMYEKRLRAHVEENNLRQEVFFFFFFFCSVIIGLHLHQVPGECFAFAVI